jgi:hypothetical protein
MIFTEESAEVSEQLTRLYHGKCYKYLYRVYIISRLHISRDFVEPRTEAPLGYARPF